MIRSIKAKANYQAAALKPAAWSDIASGFSCVLGICLDSEMGGNNATDRDAGHLTP